MTPTVVVVMLGLRLGSGLLAVLTLGGRYCAHERQLGGEVPGPLFCLICPVGLGGGSRGVGVGRARDSSESCGVRIVAVGAMLDEGGLGGGQPPGGLVVPLILGVLVFRPRTPMALEVKVDASREGVH